MHEPIVYHCNDAEWMASKRQSVSLQDSRANSPGDFQSTMTVGASAVRLRGRPSSGKIRDSNYLKIVQPIPSFLTLYGDVFHSRTHHQCSNNRQDNRKKKDSTPSSFMSNVSEKEKYEYISAVLLVPPEVIQWSEFYMVMPDYFLSIMTIQ